jgi:hypothetical protein
VAGGGDTPPQDHGNRDDSVGSDQPSQGVGTLAGMALAEFPRHRFTVEEYRRMGDVGLLSPDDRVELIEGEIADMTPIGRVHASVVTRMQTFLAHALGARAIVRVQQPLQLSALSEPQPDIAVVLPRDDFYLDVAPSVTDAILVIEVAHTSLAFDRAVKLPLYGRYGVAEAWVVDVSSWTITVCTDPGSTGYATIRTVDEGGTLSVVGTDIAARDLLGPRPAALG